MLDRTKMSLSHHPAALQETVSKAGACMLLMEKRTVTSVGGCTIYVSSGGSRWQGSVCDDSCESLKIDDQKLSIHLLCQCPAESATNETYLFYHSSAPYQMSNNGAQRETENKLSTPGDCLLVQIRACRAMHPHAVGKAWQLLHQRCKLRALQTTNIEHVTISSRCHMCTAIAIRCQICRAIATHCHMCDATVKQMMSVAG